MHSQVWHTAWVCHHPTPTGLKFDASFESRLKLHVRGRVSHWFQNSEWPRPVTEVMAHLYKVPRHPKGAVAIKERWLDTPFALSFLVQLVQYTPWKLTMYGIYWILLVYDQRFHQEMMTVEGKCLHGACTIHWAFLDHEQYLIWGFHVNVRGCGACWKQMPCAVCARCKIENPKTSSGIMIYRWICPLLRA